VNKDIQFVRTLTHYKDLKDAAIYLHTSTSKFETNLFTL